MDYLIGQITLFAGNFAPRGWMFCQGQLLSIAQNTALFSILGVTYGGDGRVTFGLPDFRGRVGVQQGQGPGLSDYVLGEMSGTENVTLTQTEIPAHTHTVQANVNSASTGNPQGNFPGLAVDGGSGTEYPVYRDTTDGSMMNPTAVGLQGGSMPHNNMLPFLALNYIICVEGIYPARN